MIGNLGSSPEMGTTHRGHHGMNARSAVLYSTCTFSPEVNRLLESFVPRHNILIDDDVVHYDHDLSDDELGSHNHQWFLPCTTGFILTLRYVLGLALWKLSLHIRLDPSKLAQFWTLSRSLEVAPKNYE